MSYKPPVTGRVKSIKSKFENLSSFESLDISTSCISHLPEPKPRTSFLFKRSATSIELPPQKCREKLSINLQRQMNASTDAFAIKMRNSPAPDVVNDDDGNDNNDDRTADTLKPLKEIKDNAEMRLHRHTVDPVKRGSIKRSPAFRVGDKSAKSALQRSSSPLIKKESIDKFDDLLRRCSTDAEKLQEVGLTDTLKAVLKQPLPTGPPPKKPPRTFIDSPSPRENRQPIEIFARAVAATDETRKKSILSPHELRNKINFLENELVLRPSGRTKNSVRSTVHGSPAKPKSFSMLRCIPCSSSPVYDTMTISRRVSEVSAKPRNDGARQVGAVSSSSKLLTQSLDKPKKNASEHIYMEPFAHLKLTNLNNNNNTNNNNNHHHRRHPQPHNHSSSSSISNCSTSRVPDSNCDVDATRPPMPFPHPPTSTATVDSMVGYATTTTTTASPSPSLHHNGSSADIDSVDSSHISCTSCAADDHSLSDLSGDIHYMCTSIDDKSRSTETTESTSNGIEPTLMPRNTYDEINILVNAAFGQHSSGDSMGLATDNMDTMSTSSSASGGTAQQKNATKLFRKLTEKRKDYVRRVSEVKPMADSVTAPVASYGSLHRTFKSPVFKTFSFDNDPSDRDPDHEYDVVGSDDMPPPSIVSDRITQFSRRESISNEKSHKDVDVDGDSDNENDTNANAMGDSDAPKLFQVCLLIGYDNCNRSAYIKWKYPSDEDVPENIEQLVFPSRHMLGHNRSNQDYSLVLTDQSGYHVYGYCRRVVPESCEICFPLAYCVISVQKAPGFYFKVLREIESRHGQSEVQTDWLLQNLQNRSIPEAGKFLHLKLPTSPRPKTVFMSNHKIAPKRLSLEVNPKWLTESAAQAAFNHTDESGSSPYGAGGPSKKKSLLQEFEERKQEKNGTPFDLSLISRSHLNPRNDEIFITRPNDLRLESTELSDLYRALGPDLLITVFSSLLLERKVVLFTENISILSSCVLGLETLLYPFQWQYTLVTVLPQDLAEICQAPTPVLAGMLESLPFDIEDGIVINLDNRAVTQKCGDEKTILPSSLNESLRISLDMVDLLNQGKMLSSVLIAEAFLRFFVELFLGYNHKHFDKKLFIESHSSQQYRLFLEWFVETAMFRHFIHERYNKRQNVDETATPNSTFYDIFDARVLEKSQMKSKSTQQNMENIMKNCRIINGKAKTFKERFRNFLSSNSSSSNNSCSSNN